jgi:hypothetical protein
MLRPYDVLSGVPRLEDSHLRSLIDERQCAVAYTWHLAQVI